MKTTLDLPDDVSDVLRMESARRGGRKKASLSKLVADAVRMAYIPPSQSEEPTIQLNLGRVIVMKPEGVSSVDRENLLDALDD
jgi:hypothetical protein